MRTPPCSPDPRRDRHLRPGSRGLRERRRLRRRDDAPDQADAPPTGPAVVIGAQDFGESAILAQVYGQALADAGCDVRQQALGGFRDIVFTSFASGDINFTAEYAASALEFLNEQAGEATGDIDETMEFFRTASPSATSWPSTPPRPSTRTRSWSPSETADELGLSSVSDLTSDLRLGGPPDCPDNASCIPGLISVYDVDLSANFVPLDGGGPLTVAALDGGEIDVAVCSRPTV
jgi:osmoprotectant transport system substrate-binding protein